MTLAAKEAFLQGALDSGEMVRFERRFEPGTVCGYVQGIGPRFFLLSVVSDRIWFDGFECFRIGDVSDIADPHVEFVETALRLQGQNRPDPPVLDLSSIDGLLVSAGAAFQLIAIHRERVDPDVCQIGQVISVRGGKLSLLEIDPDANWDAQPSEFRTREITRVNFGGDYENALHLVGGDPPKP